MAVASVLMDRADERARAAATALARDGYEVSIVGSEAPGAEELQSLRDVGVEVHTGIALLGWVGVDRHVEAELSDGRVENYDAVAVGDPGADGGWRIVTGERPSDAVARVARVLRHPA